jgi:hypothetical protein
MRLLELHAGAKHEPLKGSLSCVSIDSNPVYSAVSYEWGSFAASKEIQLDGQVLTIRPNLHSFLIRLRRRHIRRTLWIDAICIEQGKNSERAHQVRLMHAIYSGASEVLV